MTKRLVIAGTHSGSGKTTFTTGLMHALCNRGMAVQPYKCGPDYIDPAFHTFVTGRNSRNLDLWMMGQQAVVDSCARAEKTADIGIVEGVMGMYDGFGTGKDTGSTAHLSKVLKTPVVLVVDGKGMSASAAAIVLGFQAYDPGVRIGGVILNNLHGEKHYSLLKEAIERDTGIPCYGYLNVNRAIQLESRHLGLVPSGEVDGLKEKLDMTADMVASTVDLDGLLELAGQAGSLQGSPAIHRKKVADPVRIGVARDRAFTFYYQDNLDLLEELGAELVPFSPLEDAQLPSNLHGLYIGGGFPEVFGKRLEDNVDLREEIKACSEDKMPIYAECGGLMYLCEAIEDLEGNQWQTVGVFEGTAKMTKRLQRFGYVEVAMEADGDNPLGRSDVTFRAHEFHRSLIDQIPVPTAYTVKREREGRPVETWRCGLRKNRTLAGYAHVHFAGVPELASAFLRSCEQYAKEKNHGEDE